jgi:hypothetical protein
VQALLTTFQRSLREELRQWLDGADGPGGGDNPHNGDGPQGGAGPEGAVGAGGPERAGDADGTA